ncbi:MAG: heme-binding domain-containing protein [Leptospirales bacterium]|nr:heme-binding domain-containing protein [Leptospirales bacterium]
MRTKVAAILLLLLSGLWLLPVFLGQSDAVEIDAEALPPEVRKVFIHSCIPCHSSSAPLPRIGNLEPFRYFLVRRKQMATKRLDFDQWAQLNSNKQELRRQKIRKAIEKDFMPPLDFRFFNHALSDSDRAILLKWSRP